MADEDNLTQAIIALAERFGRYGYRRITELLKADGWSVSFLGRHGSHRLDWSVARDRVNDSPPAPRHL